MIKKFNEFIDTKITYEIYNNSIIFKSIKGIEIGEMVFNVSSHEDILNEYSDSVDDFDPTILRKFNYNNPIVNIEDVWVHKEFRGQNLFRSIINIGLNALNKKYDQFILRACSDSGFPEDKLVSIYNDFGFITYQETEYDGTIMFLIYK
jgi:hypothetical protein